MFNIIPSFRKIDYRHSTYNYGEDYEPPVANEDDEEGEVSLRDSLRKVATSASERGDEEEEEEEEDDDEENGEIEDIGDKEEDSK